MIVFENRDGASFDFRLHAGPIIARLEGTEIGRSENYEQACVPYGWRLPGNTNPRIERKLATAFSALLDLQEIL